MPCLYIEQKVQVDEPDALVVPMMAYDLVLGLPRFVSRNHQIDWSKGQLLGLWTAVGNSGNEQPTTSLAQGDGSVVDNAREQPPAVYIKFLGATAFEDQLPTNEVVAALAIRIDKGTGLLGSLSLSEGVTS